MANHQRSTFSVVDGDMPMREPKSAKAHKISYGGGGGTGGGPTMDAETKNYLDAKVDAVKSQNDARFSEVLMKLDGMSAKVDAIPKPVGFWALAGMAATAVVALIGILGVMADRFDGGIAAAGVMDQFAIEQQERDQEQSERIDRAISAIEAQNDRPQESP